MTAVDLKSKADHIRRDTIKVAIANGAGHIAPSLSCVDILTALYYDLMKYDTENPRMPGRDRLVFSKAHGSYSLYSILADKGIMPSEQWEKLYREDCQLSGCLERNVDFGIEASCGSLGHGLPLAAGLAFGARLQGAAWHTYCIVGDGELQEGSTWEAIQFAMKHKLTGLTIIVDANGLQAMDHIDNILDISRHECVRRLEGFGLEANICDGHNTEILARAIACEKNSDRVGLVIAKTIKGYGLKCMENIPKFHFRIPSQADISEGGIACE